MEVKYNMNFSAESHGEDPYKPYNKSHMKYFSLNFNEIYKKKLFIIIDELFMWHIIEKGKVVNLIDYPQFIQDFVFNISYTLKPMCLDYESIKY